jgi:hypothetical protein
MPVKQETQKKTQDKEQEKTQDKEQEKTQDKTSDKPDKTVTPASDESKKLAKQDRPKADEQDSNEPEFYVHLADGSVVRTTADELPTGGGSNAAFGHWQRGDNVYQVIGIYPVEDVVGKD